MTSNPTEPAAPAERFRSFQEFWPYYVREHRVPMCRWLHFVGTTLAVLVIVLSVASGRYAWLATVPVVGYGFAWIGHFFIERNRPATFQYPLWSFLGDLKMWWLMLSGRMEGEVRRAVAAGP